jgi:hypothetical protein
MEPEGSLLCSPSPRATFLIMLLFCGKFVPPAKPPNWRTAPCNFSAFAYPQHMSLVSVVCCQVEVSATGSPTECGVSKV